MKIIFNEEHALPDFVEQWVDPEHRWDHEAQQYVAAVERCNRCGYCAYVTAHYDRKTKVLAVELKTTLYDRFAWRPANRTVLELHSTREAALRRVVAIADGWYREVEAAIPPEQTEAEVLAAHQAQHADPAKVTIPF